MTSDTFQESSAASGASTDDPRRNVADVLPLLENQQALVLYRGLHGDLDPGFLQVRFFLDGPLDAARYAAAWREVVGWHPALRSSIRDRANGTPLVVVWKEVGLPVELLDWRDESAAEQHRRMEELLDSDRARGIDVGIAPAMRLHLVRTADARHEVIWTCHHIFVDGWSAAIVLEDVMAAYRAEVAAWTGDRRARTGPRAYVAWASRRDDRELADYWSDQFAGFGGAPELYLGSGTTGSDGYGELTVDVDAELSGRVAALAADLRVTPNTAVQGAWALVLSILLGLDDVAFGTTVAGRNADVPGMDRLVGYFSNAVPIRMKVDRSAELATWLIGIRDEQFAMQQFEHASLADIQGWSDAPGHRKLFETFLVVENFPVADATGDAVVLGGFRSGLTAAFPLTIAVGMAAPWFVHLRYDRRRCDTAAAEALIDQLLATLRAMTEMKDQTVGAVIDRAGDVVSGLPVVPAPAAEQAEPVAPRNDLEARLVGIWRDHLGLPVVGVEDDYFAVGGTSLGAVRLFSTIEDEFGIALPLSTLLTMPTVAGLADVIAAAQSGEVIAPASLVPIQPNGTKRPIIAVHGGGGEILYYRSLSEQLGPDQPMYGVEPVGLDGVSEPLETVPEMASRYVEDLQAVQPSGPYQLLGYCFGGAVCLEMAAQLESAGERVDLLIVIDGGLPLDEARHETTFERARFVLRSRGTAGAARAAWQRLSNRGQVWWDGSFGGADGKERAKYADIAQACRRAFNTYQPRPVSAPITLVRSSEDQAAEGKDWHLGWGAYTPQFEIETIDAHHLALFEQPAVAALADIVRNRTVD